MNPERNSFVDQGNPFALNEYVEKTVQIFDSLKKPWTVVKKEDLPKPSSLSKLRKKVFFWKGDSAYHVENVPINKKVQLLDFNFSKLLNDIQIKRTKAGKGISNYSELLLKGMSVAWTPYVSTGMKGTTTVLLCDFRSSSVRNIVKGGFTFATSKKAEDLEISPGYLINLQDPYLSKIFRIVVLTSGLDCLPEVMFGKISLTFSFTVGSEINCLGNLSPELTLITSECASPFVQEGALIDCEEKIEIEQVIETFKKLDPVDFKNHSLTDISMLNSFLSSGSSSKKSMDISRSSFSSFESADQLLRSDSLKRSKEDFDSKIKQLELKYNKLIKDEEEEKRRNEFLKAKKEEMNLIKKIEEIEEKRRREDQKQRLERLEKAIQEKEKRKKACKHVLTAEFVAKLGKGESTSYHNRSNSL